MFSAPAMYVCQPPGVVAVVIHIDCICCLNIVSETRAILDCLCSYKAVTCNCQEVGRQFSASGPALCASAPAWCLHGTPLPLCFALLWHPCCGVPSW